MTKLGSARQAVGASLILVVITTVFEVGSMAMAPARWSLSCVGMASLGFAAFLLGSALIGWVSGYRPFKFVSDPIAPAELDRVRRRLIEQLAALGFRLAGGRALGAHEFWKRVSANDAGVGINGADNGTVAVVIDVHPTQYGGERSPVHVWVGSKTTVIWDSGESNRDRELGEFLVAMAFDRDDKPIWRPSGFEPT